MDTNEQAPAYGKGDTSYKAAGGQAGIQQLVERFYGLMGADLRCERILNMHPENIDVSIDKLSRFLCGWLGGPRRYQEKYGQIRLPMAHQHLSVSEQDKEDWLWCMTQAVSDQEYAESFQTYLIEQLRRPAERIVVVCANSNAIPKEPGNE